MKRNKRHNDTANKDAAPRKGAARPVSGASSDDRRTIAVIGGGAAGLAAAIFAGKAAAFWGCLDQVRIVVFEADERVGKSILASGNGRCNFSHSPIDARVYRSADFVERVLRDGLSGVSSVTNKQRQLEEPVETFFADCGLVWEEEPDGRRYPVTRKATSVLDVLRAAATGFGVYLSCGRKAERIEVPRTTEGLYHVRFADGSIEHAAAVVVAVGGTRSLGLEELLPPGYALVPPEPVLCPLAVREPEPRELNNIRVRASVSIFAPNGALKAAEKGELLFRTYGVSGICVFNLSRFAQPGDVLEIDFMPYVGDCDAVAYLSTRRNRMTAADAPLHATRAGRLTREGFLRGLVVAPVAQVVLKRAGVAMQAPLEKGDMPILAQTLKHFSLTVEGVGDARQAQVLRGGLAVDQFDPDTLESRLHSGLFAAGEALDVDAPCGGYNLHWAWASGMAAGIAAARRVLDQE